MLYEEFLDQLDNTELKELFDKDKNPMVFSYFEEVINSVYLNLDLNKTAFCLILNKTGFEIVQKHFMFLQAIRNLPKYFLIDYETMCSEIEKLYN